jgi:enamine deaminase RidA (YjgF/YER057c/UK114 family)
MPISPFTQAWGSRAIEHLTPDVVPIAGPPHVSIATGCSKIVFFSGQVGRLADGTPAGDTVRAQFAQALRKPRSRG